ncbi:hypothetical protein [Methanobrevibacter sp.]|uniref:hypothetical protein n=1 Tax=Methanobrevibacter sp. TaxID=66852 RepID=UPI00386C8723
MNGKKEYYIVINGIQQSVDAVESLNKQLDALEKRIDALAKKNVSVSASGGGSNAKALDEEAKMLQKIDELHQKVAASEKAEYQELLHAKEELKEYQTIAKSLAAQDNLKSGVNNLNTMQGMKAQLHDLKAAMQTVDINGDQFKQWATEANELTQKLKDIEASYGTFSRNVGNYANGVAEGMQKIVIKVGETERTFESARDASRQLNNELKSMALNGKQGTKEYDELNSAVKQLNSTLKDVEVSSAAMDNLLDTMQGITALASVGQGLSALFGLDDSAIEKSIQKLVALQNVLQGIETINKQMQTQEGIGLLLSKGNTAVDAFAAKLLKVDKGAAAASKSVKILSTSLKLLGGAGIAAAIIAITVAFDKMKKSVENMRNTINKNMDGFEAGAQAYAKAKVELDGYIRKIDEFNGSKKAEKQLIEEVTKKYDIHNKNIKDVKDLKEFLIKMSPAYLESVRAEAETMAYAAAQANLYAKNLVLLEKQKRLEAFLDRNGGFFGGPAVAQAAEDLREVENELKENAAAIEELGKKTEEAGKKAAEAQKKLVDLGVGGGREKKIKDNSKQVEKATEEAWKRINDTRLYLMKDGLAKDLRQIDISYQEEARAIRKGGVLVEEQLKLLDEKYAKQRKELFDKYSKELSLKETSAQIDELEQYADRAARALEKFNNAKSAQPELFDTETLKQYKEFIQSSDWDASIIYDGLLNQMKNGVPNAKQQIIKFYNELFGETLSESADDIDKELDTIIKDIEERLQPTINIWRRFGNELIEADGGYLEGMNLSLKDSFIYRLDLQDKFYEQGEKNFDTFNKNILEKQKEAIAKQKKLEEDAAEQERDRGLQNEFDITSGMSESEIAKIKENNKVIAENNAKVWESYNAKINAIEIEYQSKVEDAEKDYLERSKNRNKEYFDERLRVFDEFKQKFDKKLQLQPEYNDWGTFNLKKLRENYKTALDDVQTYKYEIEQALSLNEKKRSQGLISEEDANIVKDNLNAMATAADETMKEIGKKQKESWKEWWNGINQWVQQLGQVATQVIQSIGEINDAAFEKQMEALEDETDALKDQLEYQKEITQKYADDVNSIEDELATARGDRRQHLIDQLNAQMQAQRESLAEQKRIEKEQEKLDAKKKKLDDENDKRKKSQAITTAIINAALAISNAAVNNWPIPAIPMIAAATAVGAAQIAAVKAAKYADGGVLQGKSHRQGGIKVLGGSAEVEGGEYITNKRTTAKNVDLLDYINSKKRRVDLSDLIEFYADKPKSIRNMSKKYFADGGQLPSLRNDININDRILTAMEQYNERPIYVEVTEIMNKADDVRRVQTLAGL